MIITKEQVMTLADAYACEAMENMEYPNQHKVDKARAALLEAVEQLAGKSAAVESQDLTIAYMAGRHDAGKRAMSEPVCGYDETTGNCTNSPCCRATPPAAAVSEPVAKVDANDEGYWAEILPDRNVKVGQLLYATPPAEAKQPLTDDEKSVELYLEQALEYVQMVERNVTTDPRYMAHQAEQRIQSALNLVRLEGFKMAFGEIAKHADLVAKVKKAEAKPLSDEEIGELQDQHLYVNGDDYSIGGQWKFARAIEAAHGIGAKEQ